MVNNVLKIREKIIESICFRNFKSVHKMKKKIMNMDNNKIKNRKIWDKSFCRYINIGSQTSLDVCDMFYKIDINKIKSSDIQLHTNDPILICMVKNDLDRIKMILNYYRKLGVKLFAILDDSSTDGTKEYLLKQSDVDLYESDLPYTTNIRQARINRIIDIYGFNRWYLIVDSDELFSYDNMEIIKINEYIENLREKAVKSLMLDMYSKTELFSDTITSDEIEKKYIYYDNNYYYKKNMKGKFIYGGCRSRIFNDNDKKIQFTVSKISLVYFEPGMIMCNSHCMFPYIYNFGDATTLLRHYKFLKKDLESYKERITKKSFANGSLEYKSYIDAFSNNKSINLYSDKSKQWKNSKDINKILRSIKENDS